MLLLMLILLFIFTFIGKSPLLDKLRPLLFIGLLFQSLGIISVVATRMAYYFYIFYFLAIPEAITTSKFQDKRLMNLGMALFMTFFFFYTTGEGNALSVVPYKFFWEI